MDELDIIPAGDYGYNLTSNCFCTVVSHSHDKSLYYIRNLKMENYIYFEYWISKEHIVPDCNMVRVLYG